METISVTTDETATLADRLAADRARLAELSNHRDRLTSHLAVAREASGVVEAEAAQAERGLTDGTTTVGAVLQLRAEVGTGAQRVATLEAALRSVEGEHRQVGDQIVAGEREVERLNQEALARPLREEADRLTAQFVESVVGLVEPLRRRAGLARQIRETLPMARPVAEATVEGLAGRVASGLRLGHDPIIAVGLVERVLDPSAWPVVPIPRTSDERLRELLIGRKS